MAQTELWIDRTKCDGSRLCAELFPERISLDDWGYPIIAPGPIPGSLMPHAQKSVATSDGRAFGGSLRVIVTHQPDLAAARYAVDEVVQAVDLAANRFRDDSE